MNGGRRVERPGANWSAEFDGHYFVRCTQGFTGDNCEIHEPDPPLTVISIGPGAEPDNDTLPGPGQAAPSTSATRRSPITRNA